MDWILPTDFHFAVSVQHKLSGLKSHKLRKLKDVNIGIFLSYFTDEEIEVENNILTFNFLEKNATPITLPSILN